MVGSPDSVQKNVVLENNSLSAEQITGVENRKSKAGEAVLPVLRSVSLFLLGLLGVLLILLTLLVIAAEAARIICLGPAAKKQHASRTIFAAAMVLCFARGCGEMMMAFLVFSAIRVLKIAVEVGLVVGITAAIRPIGSAIFLIPYALSSSITPQVLVFLYAL